MQIKTVEKCSDEVVSSAGLRGGLFSGIDMCVFVYLHDYLRKAVGSLR